MVFVCAVQSRLRSAGKGLRVYHDRAPMPFEEPRRAVPLGGLREDSSSSFRVIVECRTIRRVHQTPCVRSGHWYGHCLRAECKLSWTFIPLV